jgi:hypothetical protein
MRTLTGADVEEVAVRAIQNVGRASYQYSPLQVLSSLGSADRLPHEELDYRAKLQFVLSDAVETLLRQVPQIINRLIQTTEAETVEGRIPIGVIDWPATWTRRLIAGRDPSVFVLRRSEIHRDVPENRLLKFVLSLLAEFADSLLREPHDSGGWATRVSWVRAHARRYATHPVLAPITASASRVGYLAARATRTPGYSDIAQLYAWYESVFERGDAQELLNLFRQFVLIPEEEERAFELLVLFRLVAYLEASGAVLGGIKLIGRGSGPCYVYRWRGRDVSVFFQGAPESSQKSSMYRKYVFETGLGASVRRPDIVLQMHDGGHVRRTLVMEAKCTTDLRPVRDGVFQLLGYVQDFGFAKEVHTSLLAVGYGRIRAVAGYPPPVTLSHRLDGQVADLSSLTVALDQWGQSL